jgi:hypothetical protein
MAVLAVLLAVSAVLLAALNDAGTVVDKIANAVITAIPYPVVGALILSRTSGNPIGWVFCAVGLFQGLNAFGDEYGRYALLTNPGSLPGGFEMGWVSFWTWMPSLALLVTFLLLLFPNGHPPSPRWRWVGWVSAAGIGMIVVPVAIAAWAVRGTGLEILGEGGVEVEGSVLVAVPVGFVFVLIGALASVTSLVIRYRRSVGEERQQLKWFMFAGGLAFTTILLAFTPIDLGEWTLGVGLIAIPVAVGFAIMKYRLYDIDRLINRTLVYAIVTGSALAVYAATVFVISTVAIGSSDNLTVAAATLVAAGAFRPLLIRVQAFVDRRFFRPQIRFAKDHRRFRLSPEGRDRSRHPHGRSRRGRPVHHAARPRVGVAPIVGGRFQDHPAHPPGDIGVKGSLSLIAAWSPWILLWSSSAQARASIGRERVLQPRTFSHTHAYSPSNLAGDT